jgi:hypothetical protein
MKGITVKLPDTTLRQLRQEARATGRSVAALIRERLETLPRRRARRSVYQITSERCALTRMSKFKKQIQTLNENQAFPFGWLALPTRRPRLSRLEIFLSFLK